MAQQDFRLLAAVRLGDGDDDIEVRPGAQLCAAAADATSPRRQKTPNEIALNILLAGMTLIFVLAVASIPSFAAYAGGAVPMIVLIALFVTLIPEGRSIVVLAKEKYGIRGRARWRRCTPTWCRSRRRPA